MPVNKVYYNNVLFGYRWGDSGKVYTLAKYGVKRAKSSAATQGRAIKASQSKRRLRVVSKKRCDGVMQRYHQKR